MKLSAEKVMIGVVALIGGYAIYKMVTAPKAIPAPSQPAQLKFTPVPLASLPDLPGALPPPEGQDVLSGDVFPVEERRGYKGRLETLPEGAVVSSTATRAQIRTLLEGLGFVDVRVYMSPNEAAAELPGPLFALANPGKGTRWFWAKWGRPTSKLSRPKGAVAIWVAQPPSTTPQVDSAVSGNLVCAGGVGNGRVAWPEYGGSWGRV